MKGQFTSLGGPSGKSLNHRSQLKSMADSLAREAILTAEWWQVSNAYALALQKDLPAEGVAVLRQALGELETALDELRGVRR